MWASFLHAGSDECGIESGIATGTMSLSAPANPTSIPTGYDQITYGGNEFLFVKQMVDGFAD